MPGDSSWLDYERCTFLSCHAAELSYVFSVENTINCTRLSDDPEKGDMVNCQVEPIYIINLIKRAFSLFFFTYLFDKKFFQITKDIFYKKNNE